MREEAERSRQARNIDRAKTLLGEGQLSRAASALVSRGMDQSSYRKLKAFIEIKSKHPQVEEATLPAEENTTWPLAVSYRQVYEAIQSFIAGTAAGLSGLRAEHLKEAKGRGEGCRVAVLGAFTCLVSVMSAGRVPKEVAPYFFGGNLFALLKKSGGPQPSCGQIGPK